MGPPAFSCSNKHINKQTKKKKVKIDRCTYYHTLLAKSIALRWATAFSTHLHTSSQLFPQLLHLLDAEASFNAQTRVRCAVGIVQGELGMQPHCSERSTIVIVEKRLSLCETVRSAGRQLLLLPGRHPPCHSPWNSSSRGAAA